jgi:hypothetical protein
VPLLVSQAHLLHFGRVLQIVIDPGLPDGEVPDVSELPPLRYFGIWLDKDTRPFVKASLENALGDPLPMDKHAEELARRVRYYSTPFAIALTCPID